MADRKFLKKTIPAVLILGIGTSVSIRGEQRAEKPSSPAPAVEYRAKRAVPKSPFLLSPSAWAGFPDLAPKVDFLIKTHQAGSTYSFEVMQYRWHWKEMPPITILGFKCKVKTTPSSTPGNWIAHGCTPGGATIDFATQGTSVTLKGGLVKSQKFVLAPEPSPLAQQFLTITAFQVEAVVSPGSSKVQETDTTNNSATWTWE